MIIIHQGQIWAANTEELLDKISAYLAHKGYAPLAEQRIKAVRGQKELICYEWRVITERHVSHKNY